MRKTGIPKSWSLLGLRLKATLMLDRWRAPELRTCSKPVHAGLPEYQCQRIQDHGNMHMFMDENIAIIAGVS